MRVLILEDEQTAAQHLTALLQELEPWLEVLGVIDSIDEGQAHWGSYAPVDLIFSDIQLADGLSFSLLEKVKVTCPIIFTTAYDEYAIRAFKLNSIDYLLKPIDRYALEASIRKYRSLARPTSDELVRQLQTLLAGQSLRPASFRQRFLVPFRDRLIPLNVTDLAYFSIESGVVSVTLLPQYPERTMNYSIDITLEELESQLDPQHFFRANRQYIVARTSIREVVIYFNGRLLLNLMPNTPSPVLISKDRVNLFKRWMEER